MLPLLLLQAQVQDFNLAAGHLAADAGSALHLPAALLDQLHPSRRHSESAVCMQLNNQGNWPSLWAGLVHDIIQDAPSAQHLIVDLLNEPDSKPAIASWNVVSHLLCSGLLQLQVCSRLPVAKPMSC